MKLFENEKIKISVVEDVLEIIENKKTHKFEIGKLLESFHEISNKNCKHDSDTNKKSAKCFKCGFEP